MIIIDVVNESGLDIWSKYEQVHILYIYSPSHQKLVKKSKPENEGEMLYTFPIWTENDIIKAARHQPARQTGRQQGITY